jgi:TolB-like protein/class 3 adenylate cyclase/tetratricopeptide (TPR) repeat protein
MEALAAGETFLFEAFRLDRRGLFRRDERGAFVPVAIGSRALDVLRVLIAAEGDLVSKNEIMAAVWPRTVVEDNNLTVQIAALRRILDQGRAEGSCIQTIAGRGYRFVPEVTRCAVGVDQDPRDLSRTGVGPSVLLADERSPPPPSSISSAERRQLTVMTCDLVGAAPLAGRLDPEDLREMIAAYHRAIAEIAAEFDGLIGKYMSDGAMVYFGYPRAHEDDAERAVRAGLGVIDAVGRLDFGAGKLQVRVGIATGLVVVGDPIGEGPVREQSVFGEAPHLSAGLLALAEPDTVVIAAGTHRLVGALFEYRDLGALEVKGIIRPVPAWQVLRPSIVANRFEALRGPTLTRLVGRDEEVDLLLRRWARVKAGDGQVVLVTGEPGIGKSRMATALVERLQAEPHLCLRYFCSPYHQNSALFPFIDQLARAAGFASEDPPAVKLEKLEGLLARAAAPDDDVALLADLFSLPASGRHPLPNLSPQRKKERTLEALIHRLEGLARRQPVVMVFEDAHWIDPTSRELLDLVVDRVCNLPVLLLVTFRPEFQAPWTGQPQVTMLALSRLDRRERTALVAQIAGGKALPGEVVAQIVDRTDGVPLFIEELTKSVLESRLLREEPDRYVLDRAVPLFAIPTTLHASLLARLDRLASVRHVAQIGAAIGREFSYELLRAVSGIPAEELQASLARLVASELVFQRGTPPDAVYTFKHALVQDAAHDSLLRSSRQRLHAQIAEALETHSPELMDSQPEVFAQHYAEAGLVEKSAACWGKAGHRSAARAAMAEAAAQLQKGLDQLALLPDTPERRRQELEFCSALGAVLLTVKGGGAAEVGHAYARARELWEQLGSPLEYVRIAYGQSRYHATRGDIDLAQRLDEDLLRVSRQRNNSTGLVLGYLSSGRNLMFAGRFASARSRLEKVLALYDPVAHGSLVHQIGNYPQTLSQAILGIVLFCLGYPDQALKRSSAAIAEARKLAHPPSFAQSLAYGARLHSHNGDNAALDERAGQLIAVATEQSFPEWRGYGVIYRGWAKVKNGDVAEGISLLRSGCTALHGPTREMGSPDFMAFLANACEIAGKPEEAVSLLDDALEIVGRLGGHYFAAELNRHKGRLLLCRGQAEAAEELYRKALAIAEKQEAKLWELRAATSLAQLWGDQGRRQEARDLLAPAYGWFTEGFDTPDLMRAADHLRSLDNGAAQTLIRTFARKEARFVGEVQAEAKPDVLAPETAAEPGTAARSGGARSPPLLSIVVLPFTNLSNDPDQEYFADGLTDDLTTDLSRISGSFVIARGTAFTYKGKSAEAKQIGRELGVRYALEGSLRRAGNQVRVNAQLIDAETDAHLWAERFDRDTVDLFPLQDEITSQIAVALGSELVIAEAARLTGHPDALDYILRGRAATYKPPSRDNLDETISLFEHALALDPRSSEAQSYLAIELMARVLDGMADTAAADVTRAEELAGKALAASPRSGLAHFAQGQVLRTQHRYAEAIPEYEMALAFNRYEMGAYAPLGWCKLHTGSIDEVIPLAEQAIRLSPRDPLISSWYSQTGAVHLLQSCTSDAIVWFEKARNANPVIPIVHAHLASAYALKGETEHAAAELAEARRLSGDDRYASISRLKAVGFLGVAKIRALYEATYFAGLRKAGMPEE